MSYPYADVLHAAERLREDVDLMHFETGAPRDKFLLAVAEWLSSVAAALRDGDSADILGLGEPTAARKAAAAYLRARYAAEAGK